MTSFNHYAFGAVADFLHRVVGGLAPAAPGYARFTVAPRPGGGLRFCSTRHDTPYGTARVDWVRTAGRLLVEVQVPVGTSADISLPTLDETSSSPPRRGGPGTPPFAAPFRAPEDDPRQPPRVDAMAAAFPAASPA